MTPRALSEPNPDLNLIFLFDSPCDRCSRPLARWSGFCSTRQKRTRGPPTSRLPKRRMRGAPSSPKTTAYWMGPLSGLSLFFLFSVWHFPDCSQHLLCNRVMLGLTKYCTTFLNGGVCKKEECLYRHDWSDEDCTFSLQEVRDG